MKKHLGGHRLKTDGVKTTVKQSMVDGTEYQLLRKGERKAHPTVR
jgi:hypothetical protein